MFDFAVSTPANTTEDAPQRTDLDLVRGVIDLVHVAFPPGPQGLLHVQIEQGGSALWPRNPGDGFAWEDFTIEFNPRHEITSDPAQLTAVTWNDDDTFGHQVTLRFNVVPREFIFPERADVPLLQSIAGMLTGRRRGVR